MIRIIKYYWFKLVMLFTFWMGDITPILKLRGLLLRPAFKKCGRNLQVASGTIINWSSNITIGNDVFIANYCWLNGVGGLKIDDEAMLGPFVVVVTGDHVFKDGSARFSGGVRAPVKLEKGCWIASHSVITRGVTVGAGALVAANAVVTKNVNSGMIWGGVPARELGPVKEYEPDVDTVGR
jgi:maltose O-acetyltransferase